MDSTEQNTGNLLRTWSEPIVIYLSGDKTDVTKNPAVEETTSFGSTSGPS